MRTGHVVVFGDEENGADNYIMNREIGEVNIVRDDGLNYLIKMYVVLPASQQTFAGQVGAP